jgi:uncharacterized protein (TIGR02145 family)
LQQNLKTTKFNNGDAIPTQSNNAAWAALTTAGYCFYNNDAVSYKDAYGALYNAYAIEDARGICPVGYHVPSDTEWATLATFLNGDANAGGSMKVPTLVYWASQPLPPLYSSDFLGVGYGQRYLNGAFGFINQYSPFWSSTQLDSTHNWRRYLAFDSAALGRDSSSVKYYGHAIRCIKD